ncbi:hypothetical protein ACIQVL_48910 [Streptomyces sp. NPDC090499]|uniref:hypothetical protein n=1 Tax=Streptomyces sp. NPDC090499 TaxID=3365965 RepID=UPI0038177656
MLRVVRKTTLDALHADRAELARASQELAQAKTEAAAATDSAIRAETTVEDLLKQLGQALADRIQAERDARQARLDRQQDKKETDRQLAELREDFTRLRDAAADTETGETTRAAIAYRVLHDLYADAWREGLLPKRPFDVVAAVLGFDTREQQPAAVTA